MLWRLRILRLGLRRGRALRRRARCAARELLLKLLVAVLKLLDRSGELPHHAFETVEPRHEFGLGHLRARRRRNDHACQHGRQQNTAEKKSHVGPP